MTDDEHKCPVCGEYYDRAVELVEEIDRESVRDASAVCVRNNAMVVMGVEAVAYVHRAG